jgi:16S rRNA (cytosine1402-N4)-methyltransferase
MKKKRRNLPVFPIDSFYQYSRFTPQKEDLKQAEEPPENINYHFPVLLDKILHYFYGAPRGIWVDGTLGDAGHTISFLKKFSEIEIIGIDQDPEMLMRAYFRIQNSNLNENLKRKVIFFQGNFCNIKEILKEFNTNAGAILLDIGLSRYHFESAGRGFSYHDYQYLDMRMNPSIPISAGEIIAKWDPLDLKKLFFEYGEERWSNTIVKKIVEKRKTEKIRTAAQLTELIESVVPKKFRGRIHPATRIFQALRIYINRELELLEMTIPDAVSCLKPGGILAVISFHSLEDRIVKRSFRKLVEDDSFKILQKKPIIPSEDEIKINKKSRSAKLRLIQKIAP